MVGEGATEVRLAPVAALARLAAAVPRARELTHLLDEVVGSALAAIELDSVHLGRAETSHGLIRVIRNAGALREDEEEWPVSETYLLEHYPQLLGDEERLEPWHGTSEQGGHDLLVPILDATGVWGAMLLRRRLGGPFTPEEQEVGQVLAGLLAAGIARVLGDEQLRALAYTDALCGLPNRRAADEKLDEWAADCDAVPQLFVVLCDVNGLKQVNDRQGHMIGDRLIRDVASRVSAAAGRFASGFAARIGGDEFLVAGLCGDPAAVRDLVQELVDSTAALPFGDGVSCGVASAQALLRREDSPQALVRSLLRIADSEQYRHKIARRAAIAARQSSPEGPAVARHTGDLAGLLSALAAAPPDLPTEEALARVASFVSAAAGGVAWLLSKVDLGAETIRMVDFGSTRGGDGDGLGGQVRLDPVVYPLSSYPATERAVREGGCFFVDTRTGDASERQLLIETGFSSMIAGGLTDRAGDGWLVEICGDSLTEDLERSEPLLHSGLAQLGRLAGHRT